VLRTQQVRSDLQRISVIRLLGAGVWTNTREASPITMLVPMAIPMFDSESTGSMAMARPRPAQRPTHKSSVTSLAALNGSTEPSPLIEGPPSEAEAGSGSPEVSDVSEVLEASDPGPQPKAEARQVDSERETAPEMAQETSVETHRIELIIDSLTRHELIEAIPVTVESLGDRVFTATVSALNLVGTGNTLGDALIVVKEQIEIQYEQLMKASERDSDEKKHFEYLQSHVKDSSSDESRHSKRSFWR